MNNKKTTVNEVNQFNREWEEFEMWKNGIVEEEIPKTVFYDYARDAPKTPPWWYKNLQRAWIAKKVKLAMKKALEEKNEVLLPNPDAVIKDISLWEDYCSQRELKRSPGRPKLPNEQRKSNLKSKRSDEMMFLLETHGYMTEDGWVYDNLGSRWKFLPNGKIELLSGDRISTHSFLLKHGTL